jgi:hypothetical protein
MDIFPCSVRPNSAANASTSNLCHAEHVKLQSESTPKRRCLRQNSDASDASTSTIFSDDSHTYAADAIYGIKTLRGSRFSMEDITVAQPNLALLHDCPQLPAEPLDFYAVYDGHGGAHVAEHCARTIHNSFAEALGTAPGRGLSVEEALTSAFHTASTTLDPSTSQLSGSTAATIAVTQDRLWTAHCGECV